MMQFLLLLTLPILLLYILHTKYNKSPIKALVPKGPPGLPLIGNLHHLAAAAKAPHVYLWHLSQKHGPIMRMSLGPKPLIVISSAELAEQVMRAQDLAFCGRPRSLGQQRLSYDCSDIAFSSYNDYWREVRKITTVHLFSLKKTLSFRPIREEEIARMVARIAARPVSQAVNLSEAAIDLGIGLICRIAFGKRYEEGGPEMRRFDGLLKRAQAAMAAFYVSDYYPMFGWVDRVGGSVGRLERVFWDLDGFYQELIDEHREANRAGAMADDILDTLIQLKESRSCVVDLTWDNIKALLMNIFIAATDTSSASIVWTMTALIKAPQVMQKVQAEMRDSIGKKGRVDEDDLHKLSYLKAVIKETFRLHPPAPLLVPRETIEKCTLSGYEIQPKTLVYVNAWAVARDPDFWENPDEFLPERFLNKNIDIKGQDFGVVPFGAGRRSCPGMAMGLLNVELSVANLLYSFDWELPKGIRAEDVDIEPLPGITAHKKNPLLLVPKRWIV